MRVHKGILPPGFVLLCGLLILLAAALSACANAFEPATETEPAVPDTLPETQAETVPDTRTEAPTLFGTEPETEPDTEPETEPVTEPVTVHTHAFGAWVITHEASCTEGGQRERSCSCGETQIESVPAHGHTVVNDPAVAPTCTDAGLTAGSHCGECGTVFGSRQSVPAHSFALTEGSRDAVTCEKCGKLVGYCGEAACGYANAVWSLDPESGDMVLTGTGAVDGVSTDPEDPYPRLAPWEAYVSAVRTLSIEDGITKIFPQAFSVYSHHDYRSIKVLSIPSSLTDVGAEAFVGCSFDVLTFDQPVYNDMMDSYSGCTIGELHVACDARLGYAIEASRIGKLVVEDGCTGIYGYFRAADIGEVVIPDTIICVDGDMVYGRAFDGDLSRVSYINVYDGGYYLGTVGNPYRIFMGSVSHDEETLRLHPGTKVLADLSLSWEKGTVVIPAGLISLGDCSFGCSEVIYEGTMAEWDELLQRADRVFSISIPVRCSDGVYTWNG